MTECLSGRIRPFRSLCDDVILALSARYLRRERVRDGYDQARHAVLGSVHPLEAVHVTPYLAGAPKVIVRSEA